MLELYRAESYFGGEEQSGYADYREQEQALRITFRRLLRTLDNRGVRGTRMLELGCGLGYLLDEARPYFEVRHGTDYSAAAVNEAAKVATQVWIGGIEAVDVEQPYDLIVSTHVIEHVYDPAGFLTAQLERLVPGGTLLVATPYMGSFWQRILGKRWPSYKLPEHIHFFDRRSLHQLLVRLGLRDVEEISYPHAFPLSLIASKLGLRLRGRLGRKCLWLPRTTLAMLGRRG